MILSRYTRLFSREKRFFLFNAESLYFSEIARELYDILIGTKWSELPDDLMKTLRHKRVIIPNDEEYIYYYDSKTRFLTDAYSSKAMSLIIAPTTNCNFQCPYCFEPKASPKSMSKEVEDKIIDYVNNQKHIEFLNLTWYGGEPLLMADEIDRLYDRLCTETEKKIGYQEVITNAYLINDRVIDIFKKINLKRIQISIDGIECNHNKTRYIKGSKAPTFHRIEQNIECLAKAMPDLLISLRVNINKANFDDFVTIYEKYQTEDWQKNIYPYPGLIREDKEDGCSLCQSSYTVSDIIPLYRTFASKGVNVDFFPHLAGKGCMLQRSSSFIVGPEGELYKCWNDVSDASKVVGSIMDNELRQYPRLMRYMHECGPFDERCKQCKILPICDGGCGMQRYRNKFEGGRFDYCSPFYEAGNLEDALFYSTLSNPNKDKKKLKV